MATAGHIPRYIGRLRSGVPDHDCGGYPIPCSIGAAAVNLGRVGETYVHAAYALDFGPGHPLNAAKAIVPDDYDYDSPVSSLEPTLRSVTGRAELLGLIAALETIEDNYPTSPNGLRRVHCFHISTSSSYAARAWLEWIPTWLDEGWPRGSKKVISNARSAAVISNAPSATVTSTAKTSADGRLKTYTTVAATAHPDEWPQYFAPDGRPHDDDLLRRLAKLRSHFDRREKMNQGSIHFWLSTDDESPAKDRALITAKSVETPKPRSRAHSTVGGSASPQAPLLPPIEIDDKGLAASPHTEAPSLVATADGTVNVESTDNSTAANATAASVEPAEDESGEDTSSDAADDDDDDDEHARQPSTQGTSPSGSDIAEPVQKLERPAPKPSSGTTAHESPRSPRRIWPLSTGKDSSSGKPSPTKEMQEYKQLLARERESRAVTRRKLKQERLEKERLWAHLQTVAASAGRAAQEEARQQRGGVLLDHMLRHETPELKRRSMTELRDKGSVAKRKPDSSRKALFRRSMPVGPDDLSFVEAAERSQEQGELSTAPAEATPPAGRKVSILRRSKSATTRATAAPALEGKAARQEDHRRRRFSTLVKVRSTTTAPEETSLGDTPSMRSGQASQATSSMRSWAGQRTDTPTPPGAFSFIDERQSNSDSRQAQTSDIYSSEGEGESDDDDDDDGSYIETRRSPAVVPPKPTKKRSLGLRVAGLFDRSRRGHVVV